MTFDSEWESHDKKFTVKPIANDKETSIYGYYVVRHDAIDDKYKEKAIKEIESVFA